MELIPIEHKFHDFIRQEFKYLVRHRVLKNIEVSAKLVKNGFALLKVLLKVFFEINIHSVRSLLAALEKGRISHLYCGIDGCPYCGEKI